jgi:hypothetical protein
MVGDYAHPTKLAQHPAAVWNAEPRLDGKMIRQSRSAKAWYNFRVKLFRKSALATASLRSSATASIFCVCLIPVSFYAHPYLSHIGVQSSFRICAWYGTITFSCQYGDGKGDWLRDNGFKPGTWDAGAQIWKTPNLVIWREVFSPGIHTYQHPYIPNAASPKNRLLKDLRVPIPLWLLAFVCALPIGIRGMYRRWRAFPPGLCPSCGYDLRATPDRCSECGAIVSKAKQVLS